MALWRWILALHRVKVARTPEEIASVRRLRYRIYVEELGDRAHYQADHARREIGSEDDTATGTTVFYVGKPDQAHAAVSVRWWPAEELPALFRHTYSTDLLPPLDGLRVAETSGLVADEKSRGGLAVVALSTVAVETMAGEHRCDVMFSTAVPGLLKAYARLGLRPYGGRPISTTTGPIVPLLGLANDLEHFRRVNSPWLPTMQKLAKEGRLSQADLSAFSAVLSESGGVVIRPELVVKEVAMALAEDRARGFIGGLSESAYQALMKGGLVMQFTTGDVVIVEGGIERDMYIILEGLLEVRRGGRYVATLERGDTVGEMALVVDVPRSASVVATTPARVLVIRYSTLARLEKESPADAVGVYRAVAGVLARRLGGEAKPD